MFSPNVEAVEVASGRQVLFVNMGLTSESPSEFSARVQTDAEWKVRLTSDVPFFGRFESEWK